MKKIIIFLKDKKLSILAFFVIAAIVAVVFRTFGSGKIDAVCLGWVVSFFIGVGKVIYDEMKKDGADKAEWIAELTGGTLGSLFALWALSL